MSDDDPDRRYASPACMAAETGHFGAAAPDDAGWRKAQRQHLLAARQAMPEVARREAEAAIAAHLDAVLATRFGGQDLVIAGYWPIRSEIDLRPWMARRAAEGRAMALPVVQAPAMPLIFRPWSPEAPMRAGAWNIPEPDSEETVIPQLLLAPLVGWDAARFRMGYGGGFYDRTLATLRPRPYAIGIGHASARLESIRPQPHDEALDLIVTETGVV